MDLELKGKVAIVTGGSRGIGKAIARELAAEGADVAVVSRGKDALEACAAELRAATGAKVLAVTADTGSDQSVRDMVAAVVAQLGRVDILVNSAALPGSTVAFPLEQLTEEAFHGQMNIKVLGYLRCIREVAPHMIANGWGRIISISGLAARQPTSIVGSLRNAAVVAMSKNVADQLAGKGITVNVVHPGGTLTEYYQGKVDELAKAEGLSQEEAKRKQFAPNLLGRVIETREIADVVAFLASPRSVAVNGDVIGVGGGVARSIYY